MNSLFYKCRRTQGVEEVCLENKEECKSSRAFESFRRRGIIEKPSRGDTVLTNSLILYGPLVKKSITLACHARGHQFKSGMGRHIGANVPRLARRSPKPLGWVRFPTVPAIFLGVAQLAERVAWEKRFLSK